MTKLNFICEAVNHILETGDGYHSVALNLEAHCLNIIILYDVAERFPFNLRRKTLTIKTAPDNKRIKAYGCVCILLARECTI